MPKEDFYIGVSQRTGYNKVIIGKKKTRLRNHMRMLKGLAARDTTTVVVSVLNLM